MMKRFGKSIGYLFYFLIVQIIVTYAFLFYKFATDMNWVTEMYSAFVDNGLFSTEYLGYVMELTIPSLIVSDIVIILPMIIKMIKNKENIIRRENPKTILLVIGMGIILNVLVSVAVESLPASITKSSYNELVSMIMIDNIWITLLTTGILAPIVEEFIFRYGIQGIYIKKSVFAGIIVSSLMFGIAHMNPIQSTYAFILGLILGYIYYKTGNLLNSIILHVTINSTSVLYEYAPLMMQAYMCLIISIVSMILVIYIVKETMQQLAIQN